MAYKICYDKFYYSYFSKYLLYYIMYYILLYNNNNNNTRRRAFTVVRRRLSFHYRPTVLLVYLVSDVSVGFCGRTACVELSLRMCIFRVCVYATRRQITFEMTRFLRKNETSEHKSRPNRLCNH